MKTKILQILFLGIFVLVFGYFYGDEYSEYRDEQKIGEKSREYISQKNDGFDIDDISKGGEISSLHITPDLGLLDDLVEYIDRAKEKIYVEIYIFTERDMRDALIRAYKRGVDVKILLENNPYKAPYLNDPHYEMFLEVGLDVRWSDPLAYSLNHSKLLLIDDMGFVSTGNFSYSLFTKNRDFLVQIEKSELLESLYDIFDTDFYHKKQQIYNESLVVSPYYSRSKIQTLVENAQNTIDFYFPYLADDEFMETLIEIAQSGVKISGIVSKDFYEENPDIIGNMEDVGMEISFLSSPSLHAKSILVDDEYLYIGSVNFSTYSFDENREIGVLIAHDDVIHSFMQQFNSDF